MATTAENITIIQQRIPDFTRTQILGVMADIYEEIYSIESEQTLYIDVATGMPPYLATTSGTYTYNCPANCRRTAAIFSTETLATYNRLRPVDPQTHYYFRNRGYYKIPVTHRPAQPDGTLATVIFQDDPGTTTDKYYHAYYLLTTPLTTEYVELQIPDWTHRQLRRAVIASLRAEQYGEPGVEEKVINDCIRNIRNQLNKGATGRMGATPIPEEYQSYDNNGYYLR